MTRLRLLLIVGLLGLAGFGVARSALGSGSCVQMPLGLIPVFKYTFIDVCYPLYGPIESSGHH
jgi:hypothetical protein